MSDYELIKRFKMGDSIDTLSGIDGSDKETIEVRLRAIMVGTDIALSLIRSERESNP